MITSYYPPFPPAQTHTCIHANNLTKRRAEIPSTAGRPNRNLVSHSMSSNSEALPATPGPEGFASPPITIILTAILLVFFFVGFFSLYFCRFFMDGMQSGWFRRTASDNTVNPADPIPTRNGLDPNLIELFPTFTYSKVKELRKEKCDLECAICLAEVADEDLLRLLTVCYHCFHRECIDLWLESHKTCPVCRHDLDLPPEDLEKTNNNATLQFANKNADHQHNNNNDQDEHAINITIHDDEEPVNVDEGDNSDVKGGILTKLTSEVFSRSHTTGHSLAVGRTGSRDHDKYTLRLLPEHVPVDGARGHHGATSSCIAFGEFSSSSSPNPKTSSRSEKIGV